MDPILFCLCAFLYFSFGYQVGRLANKEFLNRTPTENLNIAHKLLRILLFPLSYHEWNERGSEDFSLRVFAFAGIENVAAENLRQYCLWTMFLWPLKLPFVAIGLIQVVFFVVTTIVTTIVELPTKTTKLFTKKPKSNPFLIAISLKLEQLQHFHNTELVSRSEKLKVQEQELLEKEAKITEQIAKWDTLITQATDVHISPEQYEATVRQLRIQAILIKDAAREAKSSLEILATKEKELSFVLKILAEYKSTQELLAEIRPSINLDQNIAASIALGDSIVSACKEAFDVETHSTPTGQQETIALPAGENHQEERRRTLSIM